MRGSFAYSIERNVVPGLVLGKAHGDLAAARTDWTGGPTFRAMNCNYTDWTDGSSGFSAKDRRVGIRFPIEMDLNYRVGTKPAEWIAGRTVNISSSGILVRTDYSPVRGSKVQLTLAWPRLLDNRVPLRLVVDGHVVRSGAGQVAVTVQRFEFRTAREPGRAELETVPAVASGKH